MFHVCPRRCISVTSGAGSQWLILSSGGCLAHWEESSQNRRWAPVTGLPDQGSPPTLSGYKCTHIDTDICTHVLADQQECLNILGLLHTTQSDIHTQTLSFRNTEPAYLSQVAQPSFLSSLTLFCLLYYFSSSLSLSTLFPRSVRLLFTLGFPDMISMKPCSSGLALPVLPSTLIV